MNFLKSGERKELLKRLNDLFGIESLDYLLLETGKNKIRGFSGSMSKEEILEVGEIANLEIVGSYLFRDDERMGLRISMDGTGILGDCVTKNILEIEEDDVAKWFEGSNLEIINEKGVYVVKSKKSGDYLGCGVSDGKKIINYVPRERRVRRS